MRDADVVFTRISSRRGKLTIFHGACRRTFVWQQRSIKLYGRTIAVPRLTAWYGDTGATYIYSGITETPLAWTPELLGIRERVNTVAGLPLTVCCSTTIAASETVCRGIATMSLNGARSP